MGVLRGVLFFVFFGGLVWLAISHGLQQEEAGPTAAMATEQGAELPARRPNVPPPALELAEQAADEEWELAQAEQLRREDAYRRETAAAIEDSYGDSGAASSLGEGSSAGGDPEFEAFDEEERPDWLTMDSEVTHAEPVEASADMGLERLEPMPRGASGGGATALAPMRSTSSQLANLVLGAVVSTDPQLLNSYLGQGSEVSGAERQLVSTFWSAIIGDVDNARAWLEQIEVGDGVTQAQLDLLGVAVEGQRTRPIEASFGRRDPLAFAMTMALLHQEAQAAVRAGGRFREASEALSTLVQMEIDAPWTADGARLESWGELLNNCQDRHRLGVTGDWPSITYEVKSGDNLIGIRHKLLAQRPGSLLCTGLIERVNGLGQYLQPGKVLRVPTAAPNVLVDLDSRVLFYRHGDEVVRTWVVGIGRTGHETPPGTYVVGGKMREPSWMPIGQPARPYGHPENPLGTRWISWDRDGSPTSYGFHGTSDPSGVGGTVSKGCIRMHNEHVEELFELLPTGSTITVQR